MRHRLRWRFQILSSDIPLSDSAQSSLVLCLDGLYKFGRSHLHVNDFQRLGLILIVQVYQQTSEIRPGVVFSVRVGIVIGILIASRSRVIGLIILRYELAVFVMLLLFVGFFFLLIVLRRLSVVVRLLVSMPPLFLDRWCL